MKECYHLSPIKTFISKRCHDKEEQIRLLAFFAGSFLALILMSLHVFGFFGIGLPLLQFISWIRLLITLLTIVLYLTKRISLLRAFVSYAIISQVVESIRIICLIVLSPTGYEEMLVIHQIGSYTTLLYLALGFVPRASVYVTVMSIGCLVFGGLYGNEAISKQFNILFSLLSITTYQTAHRNILQILHITQEELDAYLGLCRDRKAQEKGEPKIFGLLDEQKKHNLLEAVSKLQKKYEAEQQDFAMKFPTLSEAEIEVCRYVAEGKTVSEIAIITGKSISNVSTVRGNIRKKIGLARETDLRTFLVRYRGTK